MATKTMKKDWRDEVLNDDLENPITVRDFLKLDGNHVYEAWRDMWAGAPMFELRQDTHLTHVAANPDVSPKDKYRKLNVPTNCAIRVMGVRSTKTNPIIFQCSDILSSTKNHKGVEYTSLELTLREFLECAKGAKATLLLIHETVHISKTVPEPEEIRQPDRGELWGSW